MTGGSASPLTPDEQRAADAIEERRDEWRAGQPDAWSVSPVFIRGDEIALDRVAAVVAAAKDDHLTVTSVRASSAATDGDEWEAILEDPRHGCYIQTIWRFPASEDKYLEVGETLLPESLQTRDDLIAAACSL